MESRSLRWEDLASLRHRAHDHLRRVNTSVSSRELADVLFEGESRPGDVSTLLLRTLLARDGRFRESQRGEWVLKTGVRLEAPLADASFTVVDIEATGSNLETEEIIELGLVRIERLRVVSSYQTLVRPKIGIPPWIQRLTGIDDEAVRKAPRLYTVSSEVRRLLSDAIFVAHGVDFDYRFLYRQLAREGVFLPPAPRVCTVRLGQRLCPDLPSYRLESLAERWDVSLLQPHRAVHDATAAAEIFIRLLEHPDAGRLGTVEDLVSFADAPVSALDDVSPFG